jgi:hypothetical protein
MTDVFAPWVIIIAISLAVSLHAHALGQGLLVLLCASVIPITFIKINVWLGRYTDIHVGVREHRHEVFPFCIGCVVLAFVMLAVTGAPKAVVVLLAAMLATLLVTGAVTILGKRKVSVHQAVSGGTVVILAATFGPGWWLALALVAAIGWSRIEVKGHTPDEVVWGSVLGTLAVGALYLLT